MIQRLLHTRLSRAALWLLLFASIYTVIALVGLADYLPYRSISWWLAGLVMIAVAQFRPAPRTGFIMFVFAAGCLLLYLWIPAKTVLFAALVLSFLFLLESVVGRLNHLVIFTGILGTPIFDYFSQVFSFPVRLYLTRVASRVLQQFDPLWKAEGNVLVSPKGEYSVDPACLGLHMLTISLIVAIALIGIMGKRMQKQITPLQLGILLLIVTGLNCVSNLTRIIILVFFNIAPGNILHDLAGLACFILYVLLPTRWLTRWWLQRFGYACEWGTSIRLRIPGRPVIILQGILLAGMIVAIILNREASVNDRNPSPMEAIPGYSVSRLPDHILRLKNEESLIYIKPIAGFFASDHQPTICWAGSGYEFRRIREMEKEEAYTAMLEKGTERLYTAWWYTDGKETTISQWQWRRRALLKGRRFALINITVDDPAKLKPAIEEFRKQYQKNRSTKNDE